MFYTVETIFYYKLLNTLLKTVCSILLWENHLNSHINLRILVYDYVLRILVYDYVFGTPQLQQTTVSTLWSIICAMTIADLLTILLHISTIVIVSCCLQYDISNGNCLHTVPSLKSYLPIWGISNSMHGILLQKLPKT